MGLLSCAYLQTQQRQLAEKLVRLHVVANSDSPSDQAIKLRVRDAVLAAAEPVLGSADDPEQALAAELPALECAAAEMLRALGREESVSVTLQNERFPTRDYETFSLPAGVYRDAPRDDWGGRGAQLVVRRLPNALHCGKPR